ncbi:MAG: HAD hydrolase family protein [Lachnospiraceae bacterium]|nr:HAD hydrolase family protein [Lachnospiraceae bacterium]
MLSEILNKGKAVRQVCERLNIPLCRSIAIGDSINAIEMLETAGLSICMQNGSDELKKVADDICPSVQGDGILYAFS